MIQAEIKARQVNNIFRFFDDRNCFNNANYFIYPKELELCKENN